MNKENITIYLMEYKNTESPWLNWTKAFAKYDNALEEAKSFISKSTGCKKDADGLIDQMKKYNLIWLCGVDNLEISAIPLQ